MAQEFEGVLVERGNVGVQEGIILAALGGYLEVGVEEVNSRCAAMR